jgi:hypothetical protein
MSIVGNVIIAFTQERAAVMRDNACKLCMMMTYIGPIPQPLCIPSGGLPPQPPCSALS